MEHRLDIFEVLKQINQKNFNYLETLDDETKKGFVPYVVYQWLQSSNDAKQIEMLNHINPMVFTLGEHPDLLFRLFCISSTNKYQKYSWIFKKFAKDDSNTIISQFLGCSKRVADHYKDMYTIDNVKEMAERLGYTDKEIQKLKL